MGTKKPSSKNITKHPVQLKLLLFMCVFNVVIFVQWLTLEAHLSKRIVPYPKNVYSRYILSKNVAELPIGPYLVNSRKCKIPNLDPFDPSVSRYYKSLTLKCDYKSDITYTDGDFIRINWTAIKTDYPRFTHCEKTPFYRSRVSDKRMRFETLKTRIFTNDIKVKDQFVQVSCFSNKNLIYTNYHNFVFREDFGKMRNLTRISTHDMYIEHNPANLNVLMIGIDAVSRMNFIRHMNKTRGLLMEYFNTVDFRGYNKIEDDTYLNLVSLLSGKTPDDVSKKGLIPDKLPLIWKDFARSGYVTMYAEDHTSEGPFNYLRKGFSIQPTDFYLRPYMLAVEANKRELNNDHCFRNKLYIKIIFDYIENFLSVFRNNSRFGFVYLSKLTKYDPNGLAIHDDIHFRFLSDMLDKNLLENTVLIYFSVHGMQYGLGKNTLIGRYEERLPLLMVSIPKWIQDGRPQLYENLKNNADKLISNYDLHATLMDILALSNDPMSNEIPKQVKGISLLRSIPKQRTCEIANIPAIYCACATSNQISIQDKNVQKAAQCLLTELGNTIKSYSNICEDWKLEKVKYAEKAESPDMETDRSRNRHKLVDYLLIIEVSPGTALFKGNIRLESSKNCRLVGEIKRKDTYSGPNCILDDPNLTGFCVCKKNFGVLNEKWKYTNQTFW